MYVERAAEFATAVVSGDKAAPETVRRAAQRFISDVEASANGGQWLLDCERVDRVCEFLEKLPHVKGRWAAKRERFVLSDWQVFATVNLYGWVDRDTELRRFRQAYIQVPRKNGKSFWFAGLGNYHLAVDGDYGAEVYSGATSEKQAWEVFRPAREMWRRSPDLRDQYGVEVNAKNLCILSEGARFEPIIGNPGDGSSPSCAIVDEFHEHDTWALYETMATGMGARDEPLLLCITTAGANIGGPCHDKYLECKKILSGAVEDERIFVLIYEPDEGDQWDDLGTVEKVNPNYGISVNAEFLETELKQARRSAAKQNAFRTKHLNQWVGARTAWMNMVLWQRQKTDPAKFANQRDCVIAADLASKRDLAAVSMLFREGGRYRLTSRFWASESAADEHLKYRELATDGALILTPGNATDYDEIEAWILAQCRKYDVLRFGYDPYQGAQMALHIADAGVEVVEYRQTVPNMSEPMKELERLVATGGLVHDGNKAMTWCMGNVMARLDEKDNIFPAKDKKGSLNKIDGAVAAIMAVGLWGQIDLEGASYLDAGDLVVI